MPRFVHHNHFPILLYLKLFNQIVAEVDTQYISSVVDKYCGQVDLDVDKWTVEFTRLLYECLQFLKKKGLGQ